MAYGDEFELQREATTKPERKEGTEGGQKCDHAHDGTAVAPETLYLLIFGLFGRWGIGARRIGGLAEWVAALQVDD
jgi:hypothetical protein